MQYISVKWLNFSTFNPPLDSAKSMAADAGAYSTKDASWSDNRVAKSNSMHRMNKKTRKGGAGYYADPYFNSMESTDSNNWHDAPDNDGVKGTWPYKPGPFIGGRQYYKIESRGAMGPKIMSMLGRSFLIMKMYYDS